MCLMDKCWDKSRVAVVLDRHVCSESQRSLNSSHAFIPSLSRCETVLGKSTRRLRECFVLK